MKLPTMEGEVIVQVVCDGARDFQEDINKEGSR